jgi:hypothetical protein
LDDAFDHAMVPVDNVVDCRISIGVSRRALIACCAARLAPLLSIVTVRFSNIVIFNALAVALALPAFLPGLARPTSIAGQLNRKPTGHEFIATLLVGG